MPDRQENAADSPRDPPAATARPRGRKVSPRADLGALAFAIVLPSIVTLMYFVVLEGQTPVLQQAVYVVAKTLQFAFPACWVFLVLRKKFRWGRPNRQGLLLGIAFGLVVAAAMLALALGVLEPWGFFDRAAGGVSPRAEITAKINDLGLDNLVGYAGVSIFYALLHSLLEEYYWRWFVFKRLRPYTTLGQAITISSLGFMAHHVILLATYFGWTSPVSYLLALAVAIGGAVWAWIYERSGSLYGPWFSHMLIDAAIFTIGYRLAFSA